MDLPIPVFRNDKIYIAVDYKKPNSNGFIKTRKMVVEGLYYKAIYEFVYNSIEAIHEQSGETITDKGKIKQICRMVPYVSADTIAMKILCLLKKDDDYIEGLYTCPRCRTEIITGNDGEIDNRDRISEIPINYMTEYNNSIYIELEESVKVKNQKTNEILTEMNSFELRYPTLNDFMKAESGQSDDIEIQYRAYLYALQKVNHKEIEGNWKNIYGLMLLKQAEITKMFEIREEMEKYGMQNYKERQCRRCNKVWNAPLNTANFFVSGLQLT